MNILNYLLQTNLYLTLFMGFYTLLLKNETFFRQNRIYLNTSILLSFAIPFLNSNWFQELFITQKLRETIVPTRMIYETVTIAANEGASKRAIGDIILWVYAGVMAILLLKFLYRLLLLKSTLKPKKGAAYSFFNTMVVDRELPESGIIIDHEKVHMREWHSADVLLIELASIINWFNPVVYLFKKEIRHIHEFIADEEAAAGMHSKSDYALLLFSNSLGVQPDQLSNNFFNNSLLKRRIIMLNKNKSRKTGLWKYGFSAPLFATMLVFSAASVAIENPENSDNAIKLSKQLLIDTDAIEPSAIKANQPAWNNLAENKMADEELNRPQSSKYQAKEIQGRTNSSNAEPLNPDQSYADTIMVQAEFEGGIPGLIEYLSKSLKYPDEAKKNKIQGKVILSFIVQKDGRVSDIQVLRGLGSGTDEEAVRVLANSPKWKPATKNGEKVNAQFTLPIQFQLPASSEKSN
jgi:TonB family protein